jgi:hypothetical protein
VQASVFSKRLASCSDRRGDCWRTDLRLTVAGGQSMAYYLNARRTRLVDERGLAGIMSKWHLPPQIAR